MKIKGQIILLLLMLVVCFNTDTYGAGKDTERGRPLSVDFKNDSVVIAAEFENDLNRPSAYLPADRYEFAPVMEGKEVVHDFVVQNKGSAPLEIQKVKTD